MWTAKITGKNLEEGKLRVHVEFKDGAKKFYETYYPNSVASLDDSIRNRVQLLSGLDTLVGQITEGDYTPLVKPMTPIDPVQVVLEALYQAKRELDLKLITQEEYDQKVVDYKAIK